MATSTPQATTSLSKSPKLSVRDLLPAECHLIVKYWYSCNAELLCTMGVDESKMPSVGAWEEMIEKDFERPLIKRQLYYLLWLVDDQPIGHSNLNMIEYGKRANLHLHLWPPNLRQKGLGRSFVEMCVDRYFSKFQLQSLYCEPRKENPGPNKVLKRLGFQLDSERSDIIPNFICYPQTTNLWRLER